MTYSIGDKFKQDFNGDIYILARVACDGPEMVALINIKSGAIWHTPRQVEAAFNITPAELMAIMNNDPDFEQIK